MLENLIDELKDLDDVGSFELKVGRCLSELGFDKFAYAAVRLPDNPKAPFILTTYPDAWAAHYGENDYFNRDPVMERCARTMRAFDWAAVERRNDLTSGQRALLSEARDFGVGHGATAPIHGPGGGLALLSVTSSANETEFQRLWQRHWPTVHMSALYMHSALEANLLSPDSMPRVHLTDRERECLLWTARGKTAADISGILSISKETVVFHLKNVMQKVGVYSKHHAVVKAIMMGLIHP